MISKTKTNSLIIPCFVLFVITIGMGLILYKYPGLYEDTVMPASLGVKVIKPNDQNPAFPLLHSGIAFVPNNHYGSFSAWLQMLTVFIAGGGHVLSFRISILCMAAILNCVFYYILNKTVTNKVISFISTLVIITGANTYIFTRSQYDIMYFGAILQLLSIYQIFLADNSDDIKFIRKKVLIASVLQGFAFYGYFSYLFMYPAILIWICFKFRDKERTSSSILSICGLFIGSSFYIFGYADAVITSALGKGNVTVMVLVFLAFAVYLFFTIPIYIIMSGNKNRFLIVVECFIVLLSIVAMIVVAIKAKDYILSKFQLTQSSNFNNVHKDNRFLLFFIYTMQVLAGDRMKQMTDGSMIPYAGIGIVVLYFASLIVYIVSIIRKRNNSSDKTNADELIKILCYYLASFYVCSLPIINNMWGQHFMIMQYIIVALTALHIDCWLSTKDITIKRMMACIVLCACLIIINVYENISFFTILRKTGGVGPYSNSLTTMCMDAYDNYLNGEKELYVFLDWGFMESFVYLTNNDVLYKMDPLSEDEIKTYHSDGYEIILCSWERDNVEEALNFGGIEGFDVKIEAQDQLDNEAAFFYVKY